MLKILGHRNGKNSVFAKKILRIDLAGACVLMLVLLLIFQTPMFNEMNLYVADQIYQRHVLDPDQDPGMARSSDDEIILIKLDDNTINKMGQSITWSRNKWADLIEWLNSGEDKPAVIGIDVLFEGYRYLGEEEFDATKPSAGDKALAEACKDAKNVVVAKQIEKEITSYQEVGTKKEGTIDLQAQIAYKWQPLYPELDKAASYGFSNAAVKNDGRIRYYPIKRTVDGCQSYSFGLQIAKKYEEYLALDKSAAESKGINTDSLKKQLNQISENNDNIYLEFDGDVASYMAGDHLHKSYSFCDVYHSIPGKADLTNDGSSKKNTLTPADFAGKIVLIGNWKAASGDTHLTAIDYGKPMFGVAIVAAAIRSMLDKNNNEIPQEVNGLMEPFAIVVVGMLLLAIFGLTNVLIGLMAAFALSALLLWFEYFVLFDKYGLILHPLWGPVTFGVLTVYLILCYYLRGIIEKQKLRKQFEKYMDPKLVNRVVESDAKELKLAGNKGHVVVLYADICGFTTLSEKSSPEEIVNMLNQFADISSSSIMDNEGIVDKYIGDCVMGVWNVPIEVKNPEDKAIRAAVAMIEGMRKVRKATEERLIVQGILDESRKVIQGTDQTGTVKLPPELKAHLAVGIHCGEAISGNIGTTSRMDYTVIGDTVNTASRLESTKYEIGGQKVDRTDKIFISEEMKTRLESQTHAYSYTLLGDFDLKGKEGKTRIYVVDMAAEEESDKELNERN